MAMSKSLSPFAVPEALDPKRSTFLGVKLVFIAFKIGVVCRIVILLYKKEVGLPNFFGFSSANRIYLVVWILVV